MEDKENLIRAWRRKTPQWIPISSGLPWLDYESFGYDTKELERICRKHTILFPNYQEGTLKKNYEAVFVNRPDMVKGSHWEDAWGCVWETAVTGMVGAVTRHPLENWEAFENFHCPDPDCTDGISKIDWDSLKAAARHTDREKNFFGLGLPHGHTFLRVQDLRGYVNFISDMADEDPRIDALLDLVCDFNVQLIQRFIALKPDSIGIPEDLGMQNSPMLSPAQFNQYIAPRYHRMTRPIKEAGIIVHEHSDGYIMDLMDDIIATGGDVINMQDLVNGIDNIQSYVKGRISIDLDIDRQNITVFGTPKDIDDHIRECVTKLGSKEGGLSLTYQPWPPVSPENLDAVFTSLEKYAVLEYPFA